MPKILILSSNPRGDLNLEREVSDLNKAVKRLGKNNPKFEVEIELGVRSQELPKLLAEYSPQFVHFCGHGAGEQGLVFQDENGRERLVSTEILARLFKTLQDEVNCVVLNACDSDRQSEAIVAYINYVVGMSQPILDQAAYIFAVSFYESLAAGKSVEQAYEFGCMAIQIWSADNSQSSRHRKAEYVGAVAQPAQPDLPEHLKPVLRKKNLLPSSATESNLVQEVIPQEVAPPDLPPGFEAFVRREIDRKEYKDQARGAYDNFGQFSSQKAVDLSKSECKQRQILLGKVKQSWIEGFLQPSLQNTAALSLDLKARPDAIADLSQEIEALSVELDSSYERLQGTQIYQEMGQGRTLLILGSPGAGKTIALLQLAQRLIDRSEQDLSLPIPIVFNLSSWAKDRKSIVDWLIDELLEKYQVPKSLSEPWIRNQQIIPLLDGLDEVNAEYRNDCVRFLNEFIGLFPQTEVAVCSRVRDYEALTERLQISSALCLQPLLAKQVYQFLDSVGGSLSGLKTLLKRDADLEQFAQTPLILNFMSVAYQGWSVEKLLPELHSTPDRSQHLFDTYIDRRLDRGTASEYPKKQVLRWLSWLGSRMVPEKQTIFLIEEMQPTWLQTKAQNRLYRFGSMLVGGLLIVLILWPIYAWDPLSNSLFKKGGLINALTWGLILGLIFGWGKAEIKTVETLTWPWKKTWEDLFGGLISGLKWGLLFSLFLAPIYGLLRGSEASPFYLGTAFANYGTELPGLKWGIGYGLSLGMSLGMTFGLINDIKGSEIETKTIPNQGIRRSARNVGVTGLITCLIFVPFYWFNGLLIIIFYKGLIFNISAWGESSLFDLITPGLRWGLMSGLIFGGGLACIRHLSLRLILHHSNYIPWDYAKFLDFVSDRLLMKKIGGGYVFFHRMLLEHFAQMNRS